ncbi:MAG TPA: ATP-dependent RecD-like DNA helicase [Fibrobacteraceae bacterium]|nr:ATP-dependent RecD-like DNA helicase [Fibrobacteraceae bacterium]
MKISGLLRTVTFRNAENGWSVLRVECDDALGKVPVVGIFPQLECGESLVIEGDWVEHPRFGRQFQASSFEVETPKGGEALVQYLSSGLFPGIGPVTARRIVDRFGDDTLSILDRDPEQLRQISGLTGKRLRNLRSAWGEMRASRETLLFLYSHRITGSTALRLWRHYRGETLMVIRENPYVLEEEVWGIGFSRADEIALKLGIPKDSYQRLRAGLIFALSQAANQGHTYLPRSQLLEQASLLLHLAQDEDAPHRLIYSLDGMLEEQRLELHGEGVWLPALWRAEDRIAQWVRLCVQKKEVSVGQEDLQSALHQFEQAQGFSYAPEQVQGICSAVTSPFFVLTGGPGTGKTTALRGILHLLDLRQETVALCAPTGRAARRMSELTGRTAQTLHRLLEIDSQTRRFLRNQERPLEAQVVVVDEFSMVDTWIGSALISALSPTARLLLIGDQDQLPSIGPGNILRELLSCESVPSMRLTRIFRQEGGSDIAECAHRINLGQHPNLHSGTRFHYLQAQNAEEATRLLGDLVAKEIPQKLSMDPRRDLQTLIPVHKGPLGTLVLNPFLQGLLNPGGAQVEIGGARWRTGDRVMQLHNDYEQGIFNGDVGFVRKLDAENQEMEVDFDGRSVLLSSESLGDLALSYACTVHKSQGSEYRAVVIVLDTSHHILLQRNLLYTAVTRAREEVWIIATPGALDRAIRNNRIMRRYTQLAQNIRSGEQFMEWLAEE